MFFEKNPFLSKLYEQKHAALLSHFPNLTDTQSIYQTLIQLGQQLPPPSSNILEESFLIQGCQSLTYLSTEITPTQTLHYQAHSESLISLGFAALLFSLYHGEPPELILLYPPYVIQELGLEKNLTPGRSNGLASMYAKMKQDALPLFLNTLTANKPLHVH